MIVLSRHGWISGVLMLGAMLGPGVPRAGAQPALEGPVAVSGLSPAPPPPEPRLVGPLHEALAAPGNLAGPALRVPQSPPPPKDERPTADRPGPEAQWVPGYWVWDRSQNDFAWVGGVWLTPRPGSVWVGGHWMRDADGWYRVPGGWSVLKVSGGTNLARWQTTGPPSDHPDDTPGAAPGPDYFYLTGHYAPVGDRLVWIAGFWARVQPGWDWIPARWVRRPDGWDYREGHWVRETAQADSSAPPPAIVESTPVPPNPGAERPTARPDENPRDLIAESESAARAANPSATVSTVVVVPGAVGYPMVGTVTRYVMPGQMIRPPGYPYGPQGVVVPAATPPFVQRILNRVLP